MKKFICLIAVFSLLCAAPALAAEGTNKVSGQFFALGALSGVEHQELTPLSDKELDAVEGQGVQAVIENSENFVVNIININLNINLQLGNRRFQKSKQLQKVNIIDFSKLFRENRLRQRG
jgi:hypothetical protein